MRARNITYYGYPFCLCIFNQRYKVIYTFYNILINSISVVVIRQIITSVYYYIYFNSMCNYVKVFNNIIITQFGK